jgi:Protein of unknown function (DUF3987)
MATKKARPKLEPKLQEKRLPKEICDPDAPIPYDESQAKNVFWKPDPNDEVLPKRKGFLSDCVYRHRGKEITTLFTVWSSLFIISSAVKREAWIRFGSKKLYSNFYCILVGPPGIAHKTEAINDAVELLETFTSGIEDDDLRFMKTINIISDKASPEALLEALHPRNKEPKGVSSFIFKDKNGQPRTNPETGRFLRYMKTAEAAIVAHELATLLGMQKYNMGLTDNLLALYDCDRPFSWRTVKRKKVELKNLHTTLIAGTTLQSFRASVSEGTRADGFLSRTVLVNCPRTEGRRFSRPRTVPGAPTQKELAERLRWMAMNAIGEFDLSPEADKYYDKWYNGWRDELENDTQYQGLKSRINVLVLKVALLLRIQRYDSRDRIIDLQDVKDAILIIKKTWFEALPMIRGFESDQRSFIGRLEEYIRTRKEVDKLKLQRQGKFTALELREGLAVLADEGKITISLNGSQRQYPSSNTKEIYKWSGERWLGIGDEV